MIDPNAPTLTAALFKLADAHLGLRPELRHIPRFQRDVLLDVGELQDRVWVLRPEPGSKAVVETLFFPPGARRPVILRRDPAPCVIGFARVPLRRTGIRPQATLSPVRLDLGGRVQLLEIPLEAAVDLVRLLSSSDRDRAHLDDLIGHELRRLASVEVTAATAIIAEPALRILDIIQAERDLSGKGASQAARDLMPARELRERVLQFIEAGEATRHFQEFVRSGLLTAGKARLRRLSDIVDDEGGEKTTIRDAWRVAAPQRVEALAQTVRDRSSERLRSLAAEVRALVRSGELTEARNLALDLAPCFPWDMELRYRAALAMARLGTDGDAMALLDVLLGPSLDPERNVEQLDALVNVLCGEGMDEALPPVELRDLEKMRPDELSQEAPDALERKRTKLNNWKRDDLALRAWLRDLLPPPGFKLANEEAADLVRDAYALRGRLHKDRLVRAQQLGAGGLEHARESFDAYARVSDWRPSDHYVAINAAAMAAVAGEPEAAKDYATRAIRTAGQASDYWSLATVAEGQALLGKTEAALESLARAVEDATASEAYADITSMRRQYLLLSPVCASAAELHRALPGESVSVVTGHMMPLDRITEAERQHFSETLAKLFREATGTAHRPEMGHSSPELPRHLFTALARGADLITARAHMSAGETCRLHVVLPFSPEEFRAVSVGLPGQGDHQRYWNAEFDDMMAGAASMHVVMPEPIPEADRWSGFVVGNWVMTGLALLKADAVMATQRQFVAVVADKAASSLEGAFALAAEWERNGLNVTRLPCAWRQPFSGPVPCPRELPWELVAHIQGVNDWRSLSVLLVRYGLPISNFAPAAGPKGWLALRAALTDGALAAICRAASEYSLRVIAEFVYVSEKKKKVDLAVDVGEGEALPEASVLVGPNLAAVVRFRHDVIVSVIPSGLLKRDRKNTNETRLVAASTPLWRLVLRN